MPKSIENTVFVRLVPAPTHKVKRHELEDVFSQIGPVKKSSWINAKQPHADKNTKNGGNDDTTTPGEGYTPASSKGFGFVKYLTQQDAESAANELNNSKIQMEGQNFTLKVELASTTANHQQSNQDKAQQSKNSESKSRSVESTKEHSAEEDTSLLKKKSRIIIRNLSFYAKEQHIRKVMESKFGKVLDVHLPRVKDNLHVGFAFVTFQDPKDAQNAVTTKKVDISKRTVSMDWSLPKKVHQQQKQLQQQQKEIEDGKDSDAENEDDHDSHPELHDEKEDNDDDDDSSSSEGSSANDSDGSDSTSSQSDEDDSDDDTDQNSDVDNDEDQMDEDESQQHDDAVDKKCTLFLRNLPFDVSRHDVFEAFHRFGYITGTYLVKDKDTGMPKGTAFVTFSKPQSARRAIDYACTEGSEFVSQREGSTRMNVSESESSTNRGSMMIKGRRVYVDLAVDKETAATFDSKEDRMPSADRRNLYLQAESRVESSSTDPNADNTNTWDDIPPQDQKKRQSALRDKTTKLQSPIFFINPNRLSFRNLAKHVDEVGFQQLCEQAVKRGLENGLVSAKDQIAHMRALGEMSTRDILAKVQEMERNNEKIIPQWENGDVEAHRQLKYNIPSVYIARDFGPTGKKTDAPSRGFAFAEFTHHAHALACLRELNNNAAYSREFVAGGKAADNMKKRSRKNKKGTPAGSESGGGGGNDFVGVDGKVHVPRLIVDFTVENKVKAKKQAERRMQQQLNSSKQYWENKEKKLAAAGAGTETKKRSRGAIQREKKRQRRESGEEEKERQAKLEAKALADARKELRKERQALKKQKAEEAKKKTVKPSKKKKKQTDEEDERFDDMVRSYATKLESVRTQQSEERNPRDAVKSKRWFE